MCTICVQVITICPLTICPVPSDLCHGRRWQVVSAHEENGEESMQLKGLLDTANTPREGPFITKIGIISV